MKLKVLMKSILSMSVSAGMVFGLLSANKDLLNVKGDEVHGTGALLEICSNSENLVSNTNSIYSNTETMSTVYTPPSFDITTNPLYKRFFPKIGDQGSIDSCVGWATTYYQFTYEANRLRNITTISPGNDQNLEPNTYSPAVTYNYINCGRNIPVNIYDAYMVLENQGAIKESSHSSDSSSYSFDWPTDESELVKSLSLRGTREIISYNSDNPNIDVIKSKIYSGHIAVVRLDSAKWGITSNASGQKVIVRGGTGGNIPSKGHAMTVVGYDDNFTVQVGPNKYLTGAFKLANSWGETWENGNSGFIWVSYDALRTTSQVSSWESPYSINGIVRSPIFTENEFLFLNVEEYEVNYAGVVNFTTKDAWRLKFTTSERNRRNANERWKNSSVNPSYSPLNNMKSYKLAFDCFTNNSIVNLDQYLSSRWGMEIDASNALTVAPWSYKIVDNLNNTIASSNNSLSIVAGNYGYVGVSTDLVKGRVSNYDNHPFTSLDVSRVSQYTVGNYQFSNLQKYLADYNNDGEVNVVDVALMQAILSSRNSISPDAPVASLGCSLKEYINRECNMEMDEFVNLNRRYINESEALFLKS